MDSHLPRRRGALRLGLLATSALLLQACGDGESGSSGGSATIGVASVASRATPAASDCSPFTTPALFASADSVPTPRSVLNFDLGSRAVSNDEANLYLDRIDAASDRVVTGVIARWTPPDQTSELTLRYALVGSEANLRAANLDKLRKAIRQLMDPDTAPATAAALVASLPAVLWVAGNVHGNEKSGADAALRVLYELAAREDCVASRIRDNAVVVILPIQNPYGRAVGTRRNFYGFDMNRDWFARTQLETDAKLELLRQYPPQLFIDAHETSLNQYFFPPTADPTYHEVPAVVAKDRNYNWVSNIYSPAIAAEFERQKIAYFHGAPYDLYAAEYGDSVTTLGFHAAGMTFEKYGGASYSSKTYEHYVALWSSLFAAASHKPAILGQWRDSHAEARQQGLDGLLAPNGIYYDAKSLYQPVPGTPVRHYFLKPGSDAWHQREVERLVRRLQRMDVQVWRLQAPLTVNDFHAYGGATGAETLPAGSFWIPMAQARKHWIQALLHHDPYIPVALSYDVSAWSNPLLLNVAGGASGDALLAPDATPVPALAEPLAPSLPAGAPRIGLFEIPGSTGFESAGTVRHLFEQVWKIPYARASADQVRAGLAGIDVLLVPDGYANAGLQALGAKGQKALAAWVASGGRYVGYLGGTELAIGAGISTAVLKPSHTAAPGTLLRIELDPGHALAAGTASAWVMYNDDALMSAGTGTTVASFPASLTPGVDTSGLAEGVGELAGSAVAIDETLGQGRSLVLAFDPNFRGWTEGTQRLLWNALFGSSGFTLATETPKARAAALDTATSALKALPDTGKPIRIVVRPEDADVTRALLQRYGAEFKELRRPERTVFLIANREGLSREEHPYALQLARELSQRIQPISFSAP